MNTLSGYSKNTLSDLYALTASGGHFPIHNGRNNEADKLVRTDSNGYLNTGWINTTSGNFSGTPSRIYASNDAYIRYMTPANFFPTLANSDKQLSITVGGQNRKLTIDYATSTLSLASAFSFGGGQQNGKYYYIGYINLKSNWEGFHTVLNFTGVEAAWGGQLYIGFRLRNSTTAFSGVLTKWLSLTDPIFNDSIYGTYEDSVDSTDNAPIRIVRLYIKLPADYKSSGVSVIFQSKSLTLTGGYYDSMTGTQFIQSTGPNADTVDGQHFNYSNTSNSPTYLWATNANGTSFLAARASMSVNYANSAGSATTATTATKASYYTLGPSATHTSVWDCNAPDRIVYSDYGAADKNVSNAPTGWTYGTLLELGHMNQRGQNGSLNLQLMWDVAHGTTNGGTLWFRGKCSTYKWAKNWCKVLTDQNSSVSGGGSNWGSSITINIGGTSKTLTIPAIPTSLPANGGTSTDAYYLKSVSPTSNPRFWYYMGQPAIADVFEGSSSDYSIYSYPKDGTYVSNTHVNIQNLRLQWSTSYFHDVFTSPNDRYLWHRNVYDGSAKAWSRIVEEDCDSYTSTWNISINGSSSTLKVNDIRGTAHLPNSDTYPQKSLIAWFNNQGVPSSAWYSGITLKGWTNDYVTWQLCSLSASGVDTNHNLWFRSGITDTWGSWKTILDSSNYTDYTVKKDGTGATGTWGINISGTASKATNDIDGNSIKTTYLRKVTVDNNTENDFNTFENMTLTGRGDPKTGASLSNAPWTGSGPAGGYGVLTYLWGGYGTQMAWGYGSNKIYIRYRYYSGGVVWSTTWDSLALTSDIPTKVSQLTNDSGYLTSRGYVGTTAIQASSVAQALTGITNATISGVTNTDTLTISNTSGTGHINFSRGSYNYITMPSGGLLHILPNGTGVSASNGMVFSSNGLHPASNAAYSLGTSSLKWNTVYANTFNGNASSASNLKNNSSGAVDSISFYRASGVSETLASSPSYCKPANVDSDGNTMILRMRWSSGAHGHDIYAGPNESELWHRNTKNSTQVWRKFIDSGNIGSQSVNYASSAGYADSAGYASSAGNADTVDNYHIYVGSSAGTDSNTIYFVI